MRLRLVDHTPGLSRRIEEFEITARQLTLRELIEARVRREVDHFNRERPDVYSGLVEPEEAERLLNGYHVKRGRQLDPDTECRRALSAFNSNGFVVFSAGRQLDSLDEMIDLETAGEVEFVRLVPLIGG